MKNKIIMLILSVALVVSLVLVGCVPEEAPVEVEVVKIGGVYPLTGPFAPFGIGDKQAIDLALEKINA
ncbi:MAG: hypothetical protein OEW82_01680, partial [Dehalococcoidia bacterium]|nr:hypothetical protein [Dehalococcoidia bacterium]